MAKLVVNQEKVSFDSRAAAMVRLLRPRQWIKNALVLAALVFSGEMLIPVSVGQAVTAFVSFCLASSAVYCINDVKDAEQDRLHPKKRLRPIASRLVTSGEAITAAIILAVGSLGLAILVNWLTATIVVAYIISNLLYSFWLKHVVLIDVFLVAMGFVLRAAAGATAIDVQMSRWFLVCVMLLSLFLAVTKRRHEVTNIALAAHHRKVLAEYPIALLDQMTAVLSGALIVTYLLYVTEPGRSALFFLTSPMVVYGIFRYLYLVHRHAEGGSPDELLLSDRPLLITVVLWGLVSEAVIYLTGV